MHSDFVLAFELVATNYKLFAQFVYTLMCFVLLYYIETDNEKETVYCSRALGLFWQFSPLLFTVFAQLPELIV